MTTSNFFVMFSSSLTNLGLTNVFSFLVSSPFFFDSSLDSSLLFSITTGSDSSNTILSSNTASSSLIGWPAGLLFNLQHLLGIKMDIYITHLWESSWKLPLNVVKRCPDKNAHEEWRCQEIGNYLGKPKYYISELHSSIKISLFTWNLRDNETILINLYPTEN